MAKQKVSEREYLGQDGSLVDRIEQATGARYSIGRKDGDEFKVTEKFDQQFGPKGSIVTMCAILGWHTKLGNVANTVLNDKDAPGTVDDAAVAILDFIKAATDTLPVWAERVGGAGGGLRYNPEFMAQAIASVTGKPAEGFAAKMSWRVNSKGEQVSVAPGGDWPKGCVSYPAYAYRNAAVKAAYDKLAGSGTDAATL